MKYTSPWGLQKHSAELKRRIYKCFQHSKKNISSNYFNFLHSIEFLLHFQSSLFNNSKTKNQNVSTQKDDFERRLYAKIQYFKIFKTFYMSQMNTAYSA